MQITLYDLATRFVGVSELTAPSQDHPLISWWLSLCGYGLSSHDETPWCSAFINGLAWELRLPRSKSAAARSWLTVGTPVPLSEARVGFDVVILQRGTPPQPGPEVTSGASGHVTLFGGIENGQILGLGGNQGNGVSIGRFDANLLLGIRRLN